MQVHHSPRLAWTLPEHPRAWPFGGGTNVIGLHLAALRKRLEARGADLGDRTLLTKLVRKVPGLELLSGQCGVDPQTTLHRLFLELEPFDRVKQGTLIAVQGGLDAPRVLACLAALAPLGLRPGRLGPYPAVRGLYKRRPLVIFALARDTLLLAVGSAAARVERVVNGKARGIAPADLKRHLLARSDTALTVTISHWVASKVSLLSKPLFWFVRMLRHGWMQVSIPAPGKLVLSGVIRTRGALAALKLRARWAVLSGLVGLFNADAKILLSAVTVRNKWRDLHLRIAPTKAHRQALWRLVDQLLTRLKKLRKARPRPRPAA